MHSQIAEEVFCRKMTDFFGEFIENKQEFLLADGTLPLVTIREVVELLFQNRVFTSAREMRRAALREYGIILPNAVFEPADKM